MEGASARRFERIGNLSRHRRALLMHLCHVGNRFQQHPRIRMSRFRKQCPLISKFNQAPEIHDAHAIADVMHNGKVMRNKEIRQADLPLQILHQI